MATKDCFCECGNVAIRYRAQMKEHYLYVDEDKLRECGVCPLFAKCMFMRYNELIREMLKLIDHPGSDPRPRIG